MRYALFDRRQTYSLRQIIGPGDMDIWDYCLRRLFVQRATPLQKSILWVTKLSTAPLWLTFHVLLSSLGPGAQTLLEMTKGVVDPNISPRELPMSDWAKLAQAFKDWPFAPQVLARLLHTSSGKLTPRQDVSIQDMIENRDHKNSNRF